LVAEYSAPGIGAAAVLCDRHPPSALAYRVVGPDLQAVDLSYGQLRVESEKFATVLASLGIGPGDRVATLMGKSVGYLVVLMGIWRLGAVHVPIFTAFAPAGIAFRLQRSRARLVICDAGQQDKLLPGEDMPVTLPWQVMTTGTEGAPPWMLRFAELMANAEPGRPAAMLGRDAPIIHIFTSGTTGTPKAVVVPIKALAAFQTYGEFGLGVRPDDLFWNAADPGWAYGLYFGILVTFTTGAPGLLLQAGFDAATTFEVLARYRVTNFAAAPTAYRSMRACTHATPEITALRCATSAGEPLTPEVNEWAKNALGVAVYDHYGQTETGMLVNNHHHPDLAMPPKPGSMGVPMPGWKLTVLKDHADSPAEIGELGRVAIDWPNSKLAWFSGYEGDPAKTAEKFTTDGAWYLTGDAGKRDAEGYYYFSSRDDDVIIMAGYRIGPFDVESVMVMHEAVSECAVIAVPDEIRGEVMEAFVVLRPGAVGDAAQERSLQLWVKTRYAAHAFPRKVHFVEALPKTPSGKVQRFVLRQLRREQMATGKEAGG
jgi:acetyl-CoA synthetase